MTTSDWDYGLFGVLIVYSVVSVITLVLLEKYRRWHKSFPYRQPFHLYGLIVFGLIGSWASFVSNDSLDAFATMMNESWSCSLWNYWLFHVLGINMWIVFMYLRMFDRFMIFSHRLRRLSPVRKDIARLSIIFLMSSIPIVVSANVTWGKSNATIRYSHCLLLGNMSTYSETDYTCESPLLARLILMGWYIVRIFASNRLQAELRLYSRKTHGFFCKKTGMHPRLQSIVWAVGAAHLHHGLPGLSESCGHLGRGCRCVHHQRVHQPHGCRERVVRSSTIHLQRGMSVLLHHLSTVWQDPVAQHPSAPMRSAPKCEQILAYDSYDCVHDRQTHRCAYHRARILSPAAVRTATFQSHDPTVGTHVQELHGVCALPHQARNAQSQLQSAGGVQQTSMVPCGTSTVSSEFCRRTSEQGAKHRNVLLWTSAYVSAGFARQGSADHSR